jgi:hypothetical protein
MPCPRCEADVEARAWSCPACAMPLAFGEEPLPAPLDRAVELDRRAAERGAWDFVPSVLPERSVAGCGAESKDADRDPAPDLHRALALALDPALDPHPHREPLAPSAHPERSAAGGGAESKDLDPGPDLNPDLRRGLPPLRIAAALALDALAVALAAAVPLAVASAGIAPASGALPALALPAAGFVALVGGAYALLSLALLAASPGRLAVAWIAGRDAPPAPGRPLAARAP